MSNGPDPINRRGLFQVAGMGAAGLLVAGRAAVAGPGRYAPPDPVDTGHVENGRVRFPAWRAPADTPSDPPPAPLPPEQRVGFAIVGLGRLALEEILPAFAESLKAKPVALVSGSPEKLRAVAAQYGIAADHCLDYAGFDRIRDLPEVKVVYIVLPNAMHREYCERAARAGKHVLTEKPMTVSAADGEAMVAACKAANVHLMVAYRIQYERYNNRAHALVRGGTLGRLVGFHGVNTQTTAADGAHQWRHKKAMAGGGSLFDIGLYCLNTARFLTGEEPIEIFATTYAPPGDPRYAEVEETVSFTLRFPSNTIATGFCSYGARDDKYQRLSLEQAAIDMPNAYQYQGQRLTLIGREDDATAETALRLTPKNQFAAEIDHMAECVLTNRRPYTPGEEGVQDHRLMEAIYESARTGRPVHRPPVPGRDAFRGPPPDPQG
ncbi:Gfo/Idh/MocA family protein [Sphingomonas morindae]|uniref:Gfo/Idh/MocA family oxidoreductase n=1 Tax=Sphingomonas morindae TaxID=1541170 RepID=A0ABY4X4X6_9SPHN|nr:Gfo/Idh/MocA family oxidoreductase [Sphingomonas morindae]USI71921.1 Gfo/Idh/MocA family oxidoreductase [Sphingomonas morindae]